MSAELSGTTALVTGATSGIGRAAAIELARRGAKVVVSGRDEARGQQVVDGIREAGGEALFLAGDLSDAASARSLANRAKEQAGQVDVLVNNAGIFPVGPTHETSEQDFESVYAINVKAPFFLVAELAPDMASRGHGAIVNVTTMAAELGASGASLYGSSKAALTLLTKAWAAEYGPFGVRVNAVSPGPTRTEGTSGMEEKLKAIASASPAGRVGTAEEIASAIAYLATDAAGFIHGAILAVDGGRTAV
ncbi:SDR family NAD(P)-dependent oxidoreductase [Streptomyces sp. NPDC059582]|uniref:SDR family NAD(P)-dependent oxidoreductase n=1 Tax=Streptomyces sp. NPDC059582 TaxID=3346875 RepID=UPI00367E6FF7